MSDQRPGPDKLAEGAAAPARAKASARIMVRHSKTTPYDQTGRPTLSELALTETFAGEWQGESEVRALQAQQEGLTVMVSLQRFRGTLGGRRGSFVLQGAETVRNGRISATWSVVPGSGTDELAGLRGEGGFEGEFGKGSTGTLDYWFQSDCSRPQ
jgi:hypothetical protein